MKPVIKLSNLDRVESEFIDCNEAVADEAEEILSDFFKKRKGTRYKAFTEDDLRYFVVSKNGDLEIIEEEGDWDQGEIEVDSDNNYELIYRTGEDGYVRSEEVDKEKVEDLLP